MVQETEADIRVPHGDLLRLVTSVFEAAGMSTMDATLLADTLVEADLEGVHSHGVLRVPEYVKKVTVDGVDPRGRPSIVSDRGGCFVIDGSNSMGQIGMAFAMRQVVERARTTGIAAAAIRGSNHSGAMNYYVKMAVAEGMIGMATTNALPTMSPIGGAERIVGMNPVGYGVPGGTAGPIIYDAAFGATAHGKLRVMAQKGLPIPPDWATDSAGQPTTDASKAVDGMILPSGGHKGIGLAMVMGVLSSLLSGAAYGTELGNMESGPKPGRDGHFVAAINVSFFEDIAEFTKRVDVIAQEIHGVKRVPGVDRTYLPGEIERGKHDRYARSGIPLNSVTLADVRKTASAFGVDVAPYGWLPG